MAQITVADGTTETVASVDSLDGGPVNIDGTLNLDGTLNAGETPIGPTAAAAGSTATPTASGDKDTLATAAAGATAIPTASGDKDTLATAAAGATAIPTLNGTGALIAGRTLSVGSGATTTIDSGDSFSADPVNIDGTLNLDGTLNTDATVAAGATATPTASGDKDTLATAAAGATAIPTLNGTGALIAGRTLSVASGATTTIDSGDSFSADPVNIDGTLNLDGTLNTDATVAAGATATPTASGDKPMTATLAGGASAIPTITAIKPLRRSNALTIDNTRTDSFDVQGIGNVDD